MSVFLPKDTGNNARVQTSLLINTLQQQQTASLLMLAINAKSQSHVDKKTIATVSRQLQARLSAADEFSYVLNGDNKLQKKYADLLFKYRYLLDRKISADSFSIASLQLAFEKRLEELRSPAAGLVKQTLAQDPLASSRNVYQNWRSGSQLKKSYGVWFNRAKNTALLIADVKLENYDIDRQEKAINLIKQVFSELNSAGELELRVSGPGVFAVASRADIKSDSMRLSIIASFVILLIFVLAYRSIGLIILGSLPLISAVVIAIALTALLFGSIHGITIAFGITLLGLSTDYPVHFFSHFRITRTVNETIRQIWPTIRLGVITTCIGFVAMLGASIEGLRQLGVFSIIGLITAALVTRYVVPAFINKNGNYRIGLIPDKKLQLFSTVVPVYVRSGVLLLCVILAIAYVLPVHWQQDLTTISPLSKKATMLDQKLRNNLQLPDISHIAIVSGKSVDEVLTKSEKFTPELDKLKQDDIFTGYQAAFQFLPAIARQKQNQSYLPSSENLARHVQSALTQLPFKKDSFVKFIKYVEQAKQMPPLLYSDIVNTPLGISARNLLVKISATQWLALIRFNNVKNMHALKQWAQQHDDIEYINIKEETSRIVMGFRDEAVNKFFWGALLIFVVLLVSLKDIRRSLKISLSLVLSITMVIITLNVLAIPVSLFHVIALLLVLGLGLDYSLFFSRKEHDVQAKNATLQSLLICFSSTLAVFAILASSSLPVLQAIGLTVVFGVIYSMIFSWLFTAADVTSDNFSPAGKH